MRIEWHSGEPYPTGLAFTERNPESPARVVVMDKSNGVRIEMENVSGVDINPVELGTLAGYSREEVMQVLRTLPGVIGRFDVNLVGEGTVTVHLSAPRDVPIQGFTLDGEPVQPSYSGDGEWTFEVSLSERTLSVVFPQQDTGQAYQTMAVNYMMGQATQVATMTSTIRVMARMMRAIGFL